MDVFYMIYFWMMQDYTFRNWELLFLGLFAIFAVRKFQSMNLKIFELKQKTDANEKYSLHLQKQIDEAKVKIIERTPISLGEK